MCGIAGIFNGNRDHDLAGAVRRMTAALIRRGPDDEGFWSDERLQLGFRRLAILDLSSAGHQPMVASDGRSVIVFNGELYNFPELRRELEASGVRFRSRGDTEVVLEALSRWGPAAVSRFNGMFAFGWYEIAERRLLLARDHAGIKPLYVATLPDKSVAFASQLDALVEAPGLDPDALNLDVLRLCLRLHHIPAPHSIVRHTRQLEPGHWLRVHADGRLEERAWWRLPRSSHADLRGPAAVDQLEDTLDRAVRRQLVSDVPVGVFLSGGIDSPLVAAHARTELAPKAFTIGNPGWGQDESADASRYARELALDHRVHPVSSEEAMATLADVRAAQHEPFGDFSIIPTLLVSKFARREVTVALSGDGGDELFFGYERPVSLLRDGALFRWPRVVRMACFAAGKYGLGRRRSQAIVRRDPGDYYFAVNCRIDDDEIGRLAPTLPPIPADFDLYRFGEYRGLTDLADFSRYVEFYGQMQRGLKKVDMASMHNSLEVRVPLLDREVIELSLRIDPFASLRDGKRKMVLEDALARSVPRASIPQSKRGFSVPLRTWLQGGWRDIVEETLFGSASSTDLFDRGRLWQYWDDHLSGRSDHKWGLWTLLSFEWWRQRMRARRSERASGAKAVLA